MKKIEVGHLIRVFNEGDTFSGVVVEVKDFMHNTYLPFVTLHVYDAVEKQSYDVCSSTPYYKEGEFSIIYIQDVDLPHVDKLRELYYNYHESKVEEIVPNKAYNNGIEIYVKPKKAWFKLIRTTAKMAFFDGGRCALTNISDKRRSENA